MIDDTVAALKKLEGFSERPYLDTRGRLTVGYGLNLDAGLTREEAELFVRHRVTEDYAWLMQQFPWFAELTDARKQALAEMTYQLGRKGVLSFKRMLAALAEGRWEEAGREAVDSAWARQTPTRALRVSGMLLRG